MAAAAPGAGGAPQSSSRKSSSMAVALGGGVDGGAAGARGGDVVVRRERPVVLCVWSFVCMVLVVGANGTFQIILFCCGLERVDCSAKAVPPARGRHSNYYTTIYCVTSLHVFYTVPGKSTAVALLLRFYLPEADIAIYIALLHNNIPARH